jgi:hypothetical protein
VQVELMRQGYYRNLEELGLRKLTVWVTGHNKGFAKRAFGKCLKRTCDGRILEQ